MIRANCDFEGLVVGPLSHTSDGGGLKWVHYYLLLIKIKLLCKTLNSLFNKWKPLPQWKFNIALRVEELSLLLNYTSLQ